MAARCARAAAVSSGRHLYRSNPQGCEAADLPVLQSTKFEFLINLQAAKALGIEVPASILLLADEVIE